MVKIAKLLKTKKGDSQKPPQTIVRKEIETLFQGQEPHVSVDNTNRPLITKKSRTLNSSAFFILK